VDFDLGCFWHFDPWNVDALDVRQFPCLSVIDCCSLVGSDGFAKDPILPGLDTKYTASTSCIWMDSSTFGYPVSNCLGWMRYNMIYCFKDRESTISHVKQRCPVYLDFIAEFRLRRLCKSDMLCTKRLPHNCGYNLFSVRQIGIRRDDTHVSSRYLPFTLAFNYAAYNWTMSTNCTRGGEPDLTCIQGRLVCGLLESDSSTWPCTKYSSNERLPRLSFVCVCNFNQGIAYLTNVREFSELLYFRRWSVLKYNVSERIGTLCKFRLETGFDTYCCKGGKDKLCGRKFCIEEVACLPFALQQWGCCYSHCSYGESSVVLGSKAEDYTLDNFTV